MSLYIENTDVPKGIAKNEAVKENVFSIVVSIQNAIPVLIIGPPGSSKTLSFKVWRAVNVMFWATCL